MRGNQRTRLVQRAVVQTVVVLGDRDAQDIDGRRRRRAKVLERALERLVQLRKRRARRQRTEAQLGPRAAMHVLGQVRRRRLALLVLRAVRQHVRGHLKVPGNQRPALLAKVDRHNVVRAVHTDHVRDERRVRNAKLSAKERVQHIRHIVRQLAQLTQDRQRRQRRLRRDTAAQHRLHLRPPLGQRRHLGLQQDLTRLERHRRRRIALQLRQRLQETHHALRPRMRTRHVRALHVMHQQRQQERILALNTLVRHLQLGHAVEIAFHRRAQLQQSFRPTVLERRLGANVALTQLTQHGHLMVPQAQRIRVENRIQRRGRRRERHMRRRIGHISHMSIQDRAHLRRWKRRVRPHRVAQRCLDTRRKTPRQACQHLVRLLKRQRRRAQALDERIERCVHTVRVVVAIEDVVQHLQRRSIALGRAAAVHIRLAILAQRAGKGLRAPNAARVVDIENAQQVAGIECDARRLDKSHDRIFLRHERQVHFHDLDFSDRLAGANVLPVLDKESHELARRRRADLRGIALVFEHARLPIDHKAGLAHLIQGVHSVRRTAQSQQPSAVSQLTQRYTRALPTELERPQRRRTLMRRKVVPDIVVNKVDRKLRAQRVTRRDLAAVQNAFELVTRLGRHRMRFDGRAAQHHELSGRAHGFHAFGNQSIQPRGRDAIAHERVVLEESDEVLDRRAKITPDRELLERHDHALARLVAVSAHRKYVSKLRVGILVQGSAGTHTKVAPRRWRRTKRELAQRPRARLESRIRVLGRDTARHHMPSRLRRRRQTRMARVKVDRRRAIAHLAVQRANVRDAMQRNAHGNLQLDGRNVHARHHLRRGMLDLQTRIQL